MVAGDPCLDRLTASLPLRQQYRHALGAAPDTTVVTLTSTWGPNSLLGRNPELIDAALAELTLDDHIVAAIIHPNVWFAHGPWQLRRWFTDALRSGLRLIPPLHGWQAALIASDVVIGDHGAVTGYAAALSIPTVLAAFPEHEVAPGSAAESLGRAAPHLDRRRPLPEQLAQARDQHDPSLSTRITQRASSRPGRCADILRTTFYRMIDLDEPPTTAAVSPYPNPGLDVEREAVRSCRVACTDDGAEILIRSWPGDVTPAARRGARTTETLAAVDITHPRPDIRANADILVIGPERTTTDNDLTATYPSASMVVTVVAPTLLTMLHRKYGRSEIELSAPVDLSMWPALVAAAAHRMHRDFPDTGAEQTARIGAHRISFRLTMI
ncbi:hypothetical protein [Nocardia cyriacigeorgica]|uniref:hypothetical protein n=1 Tax=Nocardia cyriacigeorgica TaxID=135487 RepID=UPI002457D0F2|nr:hypothetical protein [Nocardia cyriacigeorgica]